MNIVTRPSDAEARSAGRICPRDYSYSPSVFARAPDFAADTLYVVGGLYGNLAALEAVEALAAAEHKPPQIVFNGDFHWFDAEPHGFAAIARRVARHRALRGNVESEIARQEDIGAGCGCAYPEAVDGGVVQRSNEILARLRAQTPPAERTILSALPMHLVAQVGTLRVAIVHGDAAALAGWRFAHDTLDDSRQSLWREDVARLARVDVFTCTHTCLAALRDFSLPSGRLTIANNGAAGMPNFSDSRFGVLTRVGVTPSPHRPLYGLVRDGAHIDAIAIGYEHDAFLERFLACWLPGSPAHQSYYRRIVDGPDYALAQAAPR
jgi:hypothetical protein